MTIVKESEERTDSSVHVEVVSCAKHVSQQMRKVTSEFILGENGTWSGSRWEHLFYR